LRGLKPVIFWILLYQWGEAIGLRGDAETKRLGTPGLGGVKAIKNTVYRTKNQEIKNIARLCPLCFTFKFKIKKVFLFFK
jgi:hypothetical protein